MKRSYIAILLGVISLAVVAAVAAFSYSKEDTANDTVNPPKNLPTAGQDCGGPTDQCANGYRCIQKCGPPVAREDDPSPGYYCERDALADKPRNCPICLASNTVIATPDGQINVKDVRIGTKVWSIDVHGKRIISTVIRVGSTEVPSSHQVIHLILSDGREVWLSPNHPTSQGVPVARLHVGDRYDAAKVIQTELVHYWDTKTYDILPDSGTGLYWANDILFGSTLHQ